MSIAILPARLEDRLFLEEMFVAAANWDPSRPAEPYERLVQTDRLGRYILGWGRPGDVGRIAWAEDRPVGAAWRRFYPETEAGYGFVAESIPEVSIGVRAERRGQGIGASLLDALADDARRNGLPGLSLAVETANPALRLYLRQGYRIVRSSDEDHVLQLDLE